MLSLLKGEDSLLVNYGLADSCTADSGLAEYGLARYSLPISQHPINLGKVSPSID